MVRKVLSYALGRGLQPYDRPTIESICIAVKADGDRFSSVIAQVVKSYPFQHARGMKGQTAEDTASTTWFPPVSDRPVPVAAPEPPRSQQFRRVRPATPGQPENQTPGAVPGAGAAPARP